MARNRGPTPTTARTAQRWLGVGAVSVGLGAAMIAGSATARADDTDADTAGQSAMVRNKPGAAVHGREQAASRAGALPIRARSVRVPALEGPKALPDLQRDGAESAAVLRHMPAPETVKPASSMAVPSAPEALTEPIEPQEDPSWNMTSYLGGVKVVPGSSVQLAKQEIAAAQDILRAGTWGSGNVAAGLASLVPQLFLAQAASSLTTWQNSIERAKSSFADTVGVPVLHELAGLSLLATMAVPSLATAALQVASLATPLVGVFGAPEAASQARQLTEQARLNGLVYAVVPFVIGRGINAITTASVNGGPWSPIEYDTGSSGLSITSQYVGQSGLGPSTGTGVGGYGPDGSPTQLIYVYDSYTTRFSFRNGVSTGPTTVNIVQDGYSQAYNNYQYPDGIVGVLGLAANRGSGPNNIVNLPGELKDGVLLLQFGFWGLALFGPNPLPVRGSVAGAPDAYTQIQINEGPKQKVKGLIDSGGAFGYVPASVVGTGQTSGYLPTGTRISVYTGDGQTLLYSYTTTEDQPMGVSDGDEFNTGNIPFQLGPIYIDYSQPDGIGRTVFSYR